MKRFFERILLPFRVRRMRMEQDIALAIRRRDRAKRQAAARKAANTRFQRNMEGLRR